jgi:homoserine O-acetyltransferase
MYSTVVVTGAAGRIGGGIASKLREQGYRVVGVDIAPEPASDKKWDRFVQVDLAAAAEGNSEAADGLADAMRGAHAVVHCAAWPGPAATPPPAVVATGAATLKPPIGLEPISPAVLLRDNVASTAAVCDAAMASGSVSRVVFSSSAFAQGYTHATSGPQALRPHYLPIDEEHGPTPHESYGLSKQLGEEVLATAARTANGGTSFVSLRFTNIIKREKWDTLPWPAPTPTEPLALLMWAYTHEDDVIDAHVAAVTRPGAAAPGTHEAYIIAAPDTRFAEPTVPLLETAIGLRGVQIRGGVEAMAGNASPLSALKATQRLGVTFRSWRDDGEHGVETPAGAVDVTAGVEAPKAKRARLGASATLRGSPAARRALSDPELRHFGVGGFRLECGASLPQSATLAYKVHGPPATSDASHGVILHPTSYDAVHDELEYNIGSGKTLDSSRYTVVVCNMLGNGVSYSPSLMSEEERDALEGRMPPLFSVRDNVRAQRMLLSSALGVTAPLELVYGYSMGGLQAYEWAVSYPQDVKRIAVVCGASRCSELNAVFLGSLEAALTADAAWGAVRGGFFGRRPERGLRAFSHIYAGWGVGADWYLRKAYVSAGYTSAADFVEKSYVPAFSHCDADDLLSQIRTWRTADVAQSCGGDLTTALGKISAEVLLMPCDTDKYFTLTDSEAEAAAITPRPRATLMPIRSPAGHRAGDPHRPELKAELDHIKAAVHALMARE